jgi:cytochrome P450
LGDISIEKGTHVQVDVFSLHRHKDIWGEDADEFVPDRWFEPNVPTAFYPFGGGSIL